MDWIEWIRARPFHTDQLVAHREQSSRTPTYGDIEMAPDIDAVLARSGVDRLYAHQATAIETIRSGRDLVMATPTASGKSIGYAVPALERALESDGRTLYVAPQNALIEDQEAWLTEIAGELDDVDVAQYTGRMDRPAKQSVRDRRPDVVLTTPDMLHYGLLPHSRRLWSWLFEHLSLVILDEVHAYRGIFGSHVALVLRRLDRLAAEFGAAPQIVCCSATIGNPGAHAARLTGRSEDGFGIITDDHSESGPRTWAFWRPPETGDEGHGRRRSGHVETMHLFVELVKAGYQTLVFGRSRQLVERYAMESQRRLREAGEPGLANRVRAYEAALTHERRTSLEDGLRDGSIRGVWSTSALELGVDIGGLDAVLLDGYPGTRTDTHQRAGRAGRGTDSSLIVLVGGEDQLDEYVLGNPDTLFDQDPEAAVVNPANAHLLPDHLRCGARESWLRPSDRSHFGDDFRRRVNELEDERLLARREHEGSPRWIDAGDDSPQHAMNLRRSDGEQISLIRRDNGTSIAQLGRRDAMRDAHPGAIYHHQGQAYEVVDLDLEAGRAELASTWAEHYTRIRHDKDIALGEASRTVDVAPDVTGTFGPMSVRTQITGFVRKDSKTGATMSEESLAMPETVLDTAGLTFTIPPAVQSTHTEEGDFLGGIHAIEHGAIGLFPLEVLCDRGDVGGLSTPHHPDTGRATIFIYDGHPGGVGLAETGFDRLSTMLSRTHQLIATCECADGCPACVQSPQCGNGNEPLDPGTAVGVLEDLLPDLRPTGKR